MTSKITNETGLKIILLTALICFFAESIPAAEKYYYRWVDENGVTHVTNNPESIPQQHRTVLNRYELKENSSFSKWDDYYSYGLQIVKKYWQYILVFAGILFFLFLSGKTYQKIKFYLLGRRSALSGKLVEASGIKQMEDYEFKNKVKNRLVSSGYELKAIESDFNTISNFIAVRNRKKYAVHISTDLNEISEMKIKNIEAERNNYGCDGFIVIANTTFDKDAKEFARTTNCKLIDEAGIAESILKNRKI